MQPARVLHRLRSPGKQRKNAVHVAQPDRPEFLQALTPLLLSVLAHCVCYEVLCIAPDGRSACGLQQTPGGALAALEHTSCDRHLPCPRPPLQPSLVRGAVPPFTVSPGVLLLHAAQEGGLCTWQAQCGALAVPGAA